MKSSDTLGQQASCLLSIPGNFSASRRQAGCLRSQGRQLWRLQLMNRTRSIIVPAAFVLTMFVCASAHAQTITATVEGRTTDSSGAAVTGAKVTALNSSTGLSRSVVTSESGEYQISLLPVGEYTVTVERQGFKRDSRKVSLVIGQTATLDFALQA